MESGAKSENSGLREEVDLSMVPSEQQILTKIHPLIIMMIRNILFLLGFALLIGGCSYGPGYDSEAGPEVGPVAEVLDGDEDADPLAAEIDLSNDAAEEADYDPLATDEMGNAPE